MSLLSPKPQSPLIAQPRPLIEREALHPLDLLGIGYTLGFMTLIFGTMWFAQQVKIHADASTLTLTLPHGCQTPTQKGDTLTIRVNVKPGAVSFTECTMRPAQGAR